MANTCTVCGEKDFKPAELTAEQESVKQNVPDELPYQVCRRCGLWIQFPAPPFQYEADDEVNRRKESIQEEKGHYEWLAKRLAGSYRPKAVLDIGSSYPFLLHFLHHVHKVPKVLGIDGCGMTEEYAKELKVDAIQADFMKHDFGSEKYDLISMVHVIEHFHNPVPAVWKMKKLLNPGGVLFIRTPLNDTKGLTSWHLTAFHFQVHPIIFSQRALKMLFQTAGFETINESVGNGIGHGDYDFRAR